MGNCVTQQPRLQWGGEDWGPALAHPAGDPHAGCRKTPPLSGASVKVKLTKKQLAELVAGKLELQGSTTVEQVVAQLMKATARCEPHRRPPWRPRLRTIPERTSSSDSPG